MTAGCKGSSEPAPAQIVQQAARKTAKEARDNLSALSGAVMKGGKLRGGDAQGRPLWEVEARLIRTAGSLSAGAPQQATLFDARATLYNAGKAESTLKSKRMTLFKTLQGVRLEMREGVTGRTIGPWTGTRGAVNLAAPRADVDVQSRVIAASGGVKMTQGALNITGQTLRAQTSLKKVDVAGNVRATSPDGQVSAKTATYDWQNSKLVARTVTSVRDKTTLSGDLLNADTDAQSGVLSGHVVARGEGGNARAPRLIFNWKRDLITANDADFSSPDGAGHAATVRTDSKLRVAAATGLTLQKDGATLTAASADGFSGLSRLRGHDVHFSRADLKFSAPRVDASRADASRADSSRADSSKSSDKWVLVATGGARGENAQGKVSAPRVTWDENRGRVVASGGVHLQKDGATLTGATLDSDTQFQNAVLTGNVRGQMADGSTLAAPRLQKRGDRYLASNGATGRFNSKGAFGIVTLRGAQIEAPADGSSATATGGVTVTTATGATARAPRAVYNRKRNQITATGGVDFYDPVRKQRLHGDTMVADLGLKEVKLSNARGQGSSTILSGKTLF